MGGHFIECKIPNIAVIFFLQNLVHFFIRTISGDLFWEVARALSHCIFLIDRQIYKKMGFRLEVLVCSDLSVSNLIPTTPEYKPGLVLLS